MLNCLCQSAPVSSGRETVKIPSAAYLPDRPRGRIYTPGERAGHRNFNIFEPLQTKLQIRNRRSIKLWNLIQVPRVQVMRLWDAPVYCTAHSQGETSLGRCRGLKIFSLDYKPRACCPLSWSNEQLAWRTVRLAALSCLVSCCFHLTHNYLYQAHLSSLYFPCWKVAI